MPIPLPLAGLPLAGLPLPPAQAPVHAPGPCPMSDTQPAQDLIDTTCTPEYKLTVCPEDKEFCILKLSAGPPYEDIAFKVQPSPCLKSKS